MDNKRYKVYFHRNPNTNKIFYVGIGIGRRPHDFVHRNKIWKSYVKKHGEPIVEVPIENVAIEEAHTYERTFIAILGKRIEGNGELVNITDGGDGCLGRKMSDENKEALRKANSGKQWSEAQRQKYIAAKTGAKMKQRSEKHSLALSMSSKTRKLVAQLDLNGNWIVSHFSFRVAADYVGSAPINIQRCCNGILKTIKGYKWQVISH